MASHTLASIGHLFDHKFNNRTFMNFHADNKPIPILVTVYRVPWPGSELIGSTEKDEALQELFKTNEEILLKKKALESRVEELAVEKQVGSSQPFLTPSLHRVQLT